MTAIKVLLAEDHVVVREGTRELLARERDIQVIGEAGDGEEAVSLAVKLRPDVVVMDIAMPKVNGIEATKLIKAQCPTIAVLILTAYSNDQYIFALLDAGAAGYLLKNVHGRELIGAVRAVHAGESVLDPMVTRKVVDRLKGVRVVPNGMRGGEPLTERELEVLRLIAEGLSNREIADRLVVVVGTVKWYINNIYSKLGIHSRTQALARAKELELL